MTTYYPRPDCRYSQRKFKNPHDKRLKMHPRVEHLAQLMLSMRVDEERRMSPEYLGCKPQTAYQDHLRIKRAFGLDGVWRFDQRRLRFRRTA